MENRFLNMKESTPHFSELLFFSTATISIHVVVVANFVLSNFAL